MATTIAPPAPSAESGSFDLNSAIDAAFDSAPDTSSTTSVAEEPQPGTGDETQVAGDEQPEVQVDDNPFGDEEEDTDPEQVDQNGRNAYKMSEARMQRFREARDFVKTVQDFAPTAEAAKEHYQRASDFNAMEADFRSGDPAHVGEFLKYWGDQSPQSMGVLANQILPYLDRAGNHQAIKAIEGTVMNVRINRAYREASQEQNPERRSELLYKAQAMDHAINGKFRGEEQLPKHDPNAEAARSAKQREDQLNQREQKFFNDRWSEWDQKYISGGQEQATQKQLDSIFSLPKVKEGFTPKALEMLRQSTQREAEQQLAKDAEWSRNRNIELREIQREFTQAMKTGQKTNLEPRIKAYVDDYSARLQRLIPGIAKTLISDASKTVVSQNKATHQKLAAGAARIAPGGTGRPAPLRTDALKYSSIEEGIDKAFGD